MNNMALLSIKYLDMKRFKFYENFIFNLDFLISIINILYAFGREEIRTLLKITSLIQSLESLLLICNECFYFIFLFGREEIRTPGSGKNS